MNDKAPKRKIHRFAIASDGLNKPLEAKFCDGEPIMTIHRDGRIEVSDKLKPTETAALVLDQIKTQWMNDAQATKIRELQERIKRLEEAGEKMAELIDGGVFMKYAVQWYEAKEAKP